MQGIYVPVRARRAARTLGNNEPPRTTRFWTDADTMVLTLGLSCPAGGIFYVCQNNATEFIGCCTTNPCADGSGNCPKSNLRASSFSADSYDEIPAQQCAGTGTTTLWYTCQKNVPPFLGCCAGNPCAQGSCPSSSLAAARLSSNATSRDGFLAMVSLPATTSSPSPPTPDPTTPPNAGASGGTGLSTGAIVGIAVGAAVVVFAVLAFVVFKCGWYVGWRKKERDSYTAPFISDALVSYPGGARPVEGPNFNTYGMRPDTWALTRIAAANPTLAGARSPSVAYTGSALGSPPLSHHSYTGYKTHDPRASPPMSSVGGMQHGSPYSSYLGSDVAYQPVSELHAPTNIAAAISELPGGGDGREQYPKMPQQWGRGRGNSLHIWEGQGSPQNYTASR